MKIKTTSIIIAILLLATISSVAGNMNDTRVEQTSFDDNWWSNY